MTISKKDQIAYWSSEAFLNQYFQLLEFDEPYAKAYGTIALGWVTNPWRQHIRQITFKFINVGCGGKSTLSPDNIFISLLLINSLKSCR